MKSKLIIGTRGSRLALWQAEFVHHNLQKAHSKLEISLEVIKTSGDKLQNVSLTEIGGKGVFTKELEEALLSKRIDIAVHSLKDLPTILPENLAIAAVLPREDARDALVLSKESKISSPSIQALPQNAVVGTSSSRRAAQLKFLRPDLQLKDLRGNVDTRLRKLDENDYDAIILAAAGLKRLGFENRISAFLSFAEMLPQVGQGALAIETRCDDAETNEIVRVLENAETRAAVTAERAFLREIGGGCLLPMAAQAVVENANLLLSGLVAAPDGTKVLREEISGEISQAREIGNELANILREKGALDLL